jgi:hypothetical protein
MKISDIDSDNFIRQRSGNNRTTGWTEGSISKAKLTAWDGDLVGLTACSSALDESAPIRLFYASSSTSVEEYLWRAKKDEWVRQQTWDGYSGAAGVGCFGGTGAYRYLGLVNTENQLEIWYQASEDVGTDWQKGQSLNEPNSAKPPELTQPSQHNNQSPTSTQHPRSLSPSTTPSTKTPQRTKSESRQWTGRTSTPATTAQVFRPPRDFRAWPEPG